MKLHTLRPALGSLSKKKRIGRGEGSGKGGTAARGYNGAQSRSGYKRKFGFEGGQNPLQRRLPMHGFKNFNRVHFVPINLSLLQELAQKYNVTHIDRVFLRSQGIIGKCALYKILGDGELTHTLTVLAPACSKSALNSIEALGGKVTIMSRYE